MLRHLIFDWSGTLCDDHAFAFRLTNETIEHFGGMPLTHEEFLDEFRIPVASFYASRLPGRSLAEIESYFFGRYRSEADALPLFSDAEFLLRYCRASNFRVFIVSTIEPECIRAALERFHLLDCVEDITGRAFEKSSVIMNLLAQYALAPDETLTIGDMPHDLQAGQQARTQTGAALYGYSSKATLESVGADYYFESPMQIFEHLQKSVSLDHFQRPTVTVGGLIENSAGEVLLIRTEKWTNHWGTPGGKVELGEPAEKAFIREVLEETGLTVRDVQYVSTDEGIFSEEFREPKHFIFLNFRGKTDAAAVRLNYEAQEWRWVHPQQALGLPLNAPTRRLIECILSSKKSV